ncbi:MAG: hypothetical protein WC889_08290 [Myxococcota bacterium]
MTGKCMLSNIAIALLLAAGCQSGSKSIAKASDYTGTWSGTYSLSGAQTGAIVPFTLDNLAGMDENATVFGSLDSQYVAGAFAGTVDDTGKAVGVVDNTVDGKMWTATVARTESGISIDLHNDASSVTGLGTTGAPANGGYKTTVTNKSDVLQTITLVTEHLVSDHLEEQADLQPGETYTWETGGWCPSGFKIIKEDLPYTDCWGDPKYEKNWFWPCCRSSTWEIQAVPSSLDGVSYNYSIVKQ